jgi:hypothetical protein
VIRPLEPALTPALAKVVNVRNGEEMADKVIVTILSFNSHRAPFLARLASLIAAMLVFAMASVASAQQSFKTTEESYRRILVTERVRRQRLELAI